MVEPSTVSPRSITDEPVPGNGTPPPPVTGPEPVGWVEPEALVRLCVGENASDLHLQAGSPPVLRIDGILRPADGPALSAGVLERLAERMLPERLRETWEQGGQVDFALSVPGVGRVRVNLHRQRSSVGIVMHTVGSVPAPMVELGHPESTVALLERSEGLIVVCGPRGSGRTTTVAAMVDHLNRNTRSVIVCVEDPIEILHRHRSSLVLQREVGTDVADVTEAVAAARRQDADVLVVGSLRDAAGARAVLDAADAGTLVIVVVEARGAPEALGAIRGWFPAPDRMQINQLIARNLVGVVAQRLVRRADGAGRHLVTEVLVGTGKVADRICGPAEGETDDLLELMDAGAYHGMRTLDGALLDAYLEGLIGLREAVRHARRPQELRIAAQASRPGG